jgi:hypothetical protein
MSRPIWLNREQVWQSHLKSVGCPYLFPLSTVAKWTISRRMGGHATPLCLVLGQGGVYSMQGSHGRDHPISSRLPRLLSPANNSAITVYTKRPSRRLSKYVSKYIDRAGLGSHYHHSVRQYPTSSACRPSHVDFSTSAKYYTISSADAREAGALVRYLITSYISIDSPTFH